MDLNWTKAFTELLPKLIPGLGIAIEATILGFLTAFIIGLILALMNLSKNKLFKGIVWVILEIIRGTPLLVQLIYAYYVIPAIVTQIYRIFDPSHPEVQIPALFAGIFAIGLNYGCYMSEVIRSAVNSIDYGQMEAALALGYTERRALYRIVILEALKISIPNFTNYLIIIVKDTSLLSYITVSELLLKTKSYASQTFLTIESYTILAAFYLLISFPLTRLVNILERKVSR